MDATCREIVDWASEMDRVCRLLQLARTAFPTPSTLYRSFERVPRSVWRGFLRESANICDPGSHRAIDATFFDRETASRYYQNRSDRHMRTLKTTALVDTNTCAILDIHCSAHWPHDTQTGRRVALRSTEKIESLAGDKGYDDQYLRDAHRSEGVWPLLRHRLFGTITRTTHGWTAGYTASARWLRPPFRPSSVDSAPLSPSRLVPRVRGTRVDRRSLQPRTSTQTVIPTPSSDSTGKSSLKLNPDQLSKWIKKPSQPRNDFHSRFICRLRRRSD